MGVTWTFCSLALIIVAVRFWVRTTVTKKVNIEDWLMGVAAVSILPHYEDIVVVEF